MILPHNMIIVVRARRIDRAISIRPGAGLLLKLGLFIHRYVAIPRSGCETCDCRGNDGNKYSNILRRIDRGIIPFICKKFLNQTCCGTRPALWQQSSIARARASFTCFSSPGSGTDVTAASFHGKKIKTNRSARRLSPSLRGWYQFLQNKLKRVEIL